MSSWKQCTVSTTPHFLSLGNSNFHSFIPLLLSCSIFFCICWQRCTLEVYIAYSYTTNLPHCISQGFISQMAHMGIFHLRRSRENVLLYVYTSKHETWSYHLIMVIVLFISHMRKWVVTLQLTGCSSSQPVNCSPLIVWLQYAAWDTG